MNLIAKIKLKWAKRSSQSYIDYLRRSGVSIGKNTFIRDPRSFGIDLQRAYLITIGSDVRFNYNNHLIAHDGAAKVFRIKYQDYLPSNGRITIGNNVWFARNVTVLKGVTIGDNCIIGYGATVTHDIPSNSVAVGTPAKVICGIDEYYARRKEESLQESFECARAIVSRYHRRPVPRISGRVLSGLSAARRWTNILASRSGISWDQPTTTTAPNMWQDLLRLTSF